MGRRRCREMDSSGRGRARTMTAVLWQGSWEERGSVSTASARRQNKSLLIPDSMEQAGDFSMTIPLIFTALAVILATVIVKLRAAREKKPTEAAQEEKKETVVAEEPSEAEEKDKEDPIEEDEVGQRTESDGAIPVEEVGTVEEPPEAKENQTEVEECTAKERTPSSHSSQEEEDNKEEDFETEQDKVLKISEADDADDETFSFKYFPGKLRGSDYEKMLTKEELDEEQRDEDDKKLSLQSS